MDLGRYVIMFRLSFFGRERVEDMSLVTYFKLIFKYTPFDKLVNLDCYVLLLLLSFIIIVFAY